MCTESVLSRLVSCWEDVDRPGKVAAPLEISRIYPAKANTAAGPQRYLHPQGQHAGLQKGNSGLAVSECCKKCNWYNQNLPFLLITNLTPPYPFFRMDKDDDESICGDVVENIREVLLDRGSVII